MRNANIANINLHRVSFIIYNHDGDLIYTNIIMISILEL